MSVFFLKNAGMSKLVLTDEFISNTRCPPSRGHLEIFDETISGFYVDFLKSGRSSYRLRIRRSGKLRVVTIGNCAQMGVGEARIIAQKIISTTEQTSFLDTKEANGQVPTLGTFISSHYLPYVKSYKRSWITDESMLRLHILPRLSSLRMDAIKVSDVTELVEEMRGRKYAPGTCNRAIVLLRYAYTLAIRWGLVSTAANPMKDIKNLVDDNRIEHFLTSEQARELLSKARNSDNEMLQWIVLFLLYTGGRKREVLDCRWDDIDFVQQSWRIPKTKSGKVRHVPLSEQALDVLNQVKALYGKHNFLFVFPNVKTGLPYVSLYYSWNTARNTAGLPSIRMHDLRHSFASFLVNAGRSLYEVQEILGHADIRTTSRYAHLSQERLREAVKAVPFLK